MASKNTIRRVCLVCGTELPPQTGRGRPRQYCDVKTTGRPCARLGKVITEYRAVSEAILANVAPNKRETVLRDQRMTLRCLAQDLSLTVAQMNGDTDRAAAVGSKRDKSEDQFGA